MSAKLSAILAYAEGEISKADEIIDRAHRMLDYHGMDRWTGYRDAMIRLSAKIREDKNVGKG
jgi:hypothetical protein